MQIMKNLSIISTLLISFLLSFGLNGATFYSISNSAWSNSGPNGSNCNCSPSFTNDTVYVRHTNVSTNNALNMTTGMLVISNNGRLTVNNWGTSTIGANATVVIESGRRLTIKGNLTNNGSLTVDGELRIDDGNTFTNNGTLTISGNLNLKDWQTTINNGTITSTQGSTVSMGHFTNNGTATFGGSVTTDNYNTMTNNGTLTFSPTSTASIGHLTNSNNATLNVNGTVSLKTNWNNFNNSGTANVNGSLSVGHINNSGAVNGVGVVNVSGNKNNSGTINGCGNCNFSNNTYLVNTPNGNYKIYDGNNWNNGAPTANDDVLILSNYNRNQNEVCKNLVVAANASLNIRNNRTWTVHGTITNEGVISTENNGNLVQLNTTGNNSGNGIYQIHNSGSNSNMAYNKWSSPVQGQSLLDFFPNDNLYDIYTFYAPVQNWRYDFATLSVVNGHNYSPFQFGQNNMTPDADGTFKVGRGYFAPGSNITRKFEGKVINNGNINVDVFTTNVNVPSSWGGNDWNLIGNPYPSSISTVEFLDLNYNNGNGVIANAVYYWDHPSQKYIVKNNQDNDFIGKTQGFWVEALTTGQVQFNNSMRKTTNSKLRSAEEKVFSIHLSMTNSDDVKDDIRVYFDDLASDGVDIRFDALKMQGGNGFDFYSLLDSVNYAFQSVTYPNEFENKTIPLGVTSNKKGLFKFSIDSMVNVPANYTVRIEDLLLNRTIELTKKGDYYVELDKKGTYNDRFLLHIFRDKDIEEDPINPVNNVEELQSANTIKVHNANEMIVITHAQPSSANANVSIIDLNGRTVKQDRISQGTMTKYIDVNELNTGVYIVSIVADNGSVQNFKTFIK